MRARVVLAVVLSLLLMPASPASAAQLDARDRPEASGPLAFDGKSCFKRNIRSAGDVMAVSRMCIFLYTLSPTAEVDPLRDYGAAWAQTTVDPRNGWCARKVRSEVLLSDQARGHAAAPKDASVARPKQARTELVVDGQGLALSDGVLRQKYRLYPQDVSAAFGDEGLSYHVTWSGRTNKTLAFALGREFSVPTGDVVVGGTGPVGVGLSSLKFVRRPGC